MAARPGQVSGRFAVAIACEALARCIVIALLVVGIRAITRDSCRADEFCDDPGFQRLLVGPFVLYALWNVLAIGGVLTAPGADDPAGRARGIAIVGLVRLFWLPLVITHAGPAIAAAAVAAMLSGALGFVLVVLQQHDDRARDEAGASADVPPPEPDPGGR